MSHSTPAPPRQTSWAQHAIHPGWVVNREQKGYIIFGADEWRLGIALMVGELYEALKLAQIPEDKARAAATAVADFERRIGKIETLVSVNTAVLAMNTALVIAVAGRFFEFF